MALRDELQDLIRCYLARRAPLMHVREWLEAHVTDVSLSSDDELKCLDDLAWSLISEADQGTRTDTEIRAALALAYPDLAPVWPSEYQRPILSTSSTT
jgi:hypothetical protein